MLALKRNKYITDSNGKCVGVLVDVTTYKKFLKAVEELEDIKSYDRVKNKVKVEIKSGKSETLQEYLVKRRKKNK